MTDLKSQGFKPLPRGDSKTIVVVTGATGFIGGHIVKMLLEETDYHVRATVRSQKGATCQHLYDLAAKAGAGRLTVVDGCDLLKPGTFHAAIAGSSFVIHTASGVALTAPDKKRDIIDPAIDGTANVLTACKASGGSVKTLGITSSVAAIGADGDHGKTLTEANWNTTARVDHDEYGFSKVESEKMCWKFVESLPENQRFKVVALNPTLVTGPLLTAHLNNVGLTLISRILSRKFPAMPRFKYGIVDVRDVARAHIIAMASPRANGRYIVTTAPMWLTEVSAALNKQFPAYHPPTAQLPDWVMYLTAYLGIEKQIDVEGLKVRLGRDIAYDNTKLKTDFAAEGLDRLIPVEQSLKDTADSLIAAKLVSPGMSFGAKAGLIALAAGAVAGAAYYVRAFGLPSFLSSSASSATSTSSPSK